MMQNLETINYVEDLSLAKQGRPLYALKTFFDSISTYWQKNTHTNYYLGKLSSRAKYLVKGLIGRDRWENFKGRKSLNQIRKETKHNLSLDEIVTQKYKLKMQEYINLRDYFINSSYRNIKATTALLDDIKYVYLYTPTHFNCDISNKISKIFMDKNLGITIGDYQKLEEDFRNELFKKISLDPKVMIMDYSGKANSDTWFMDHTHLNQFGEEKFTEIIYPEVSKIVKNLITKTKL